MMPATAMNATMSANTYSSLDLAGIFPVIIATALILGIIVFSYGKFSRYKKFKGFLKVLGISCVYFGKGLIGLAFFGSILGGVWYLGTLTESGVIEWTQIGKWVGIGTGAFLGIAGFGYLCDKLWTRIREFNNRYDEEDTE